MPPTRWHFYLFDGRMRLMPKEKKKVLPKPFIRMNPVITKKNIGKINKVEKTLALHFVKTGDITPTFFINSVESARRYNQKNGRTILDYYVVIFGRDNKNNEVRISPFKKRSIDYKESLKTTYRKIREYIREVKKRYVGFKEKFLEIIYILDKDKAQAEFDARAIRSQKQKIGREKAARERALEAREEKRRNIRHKRALRKELRARGLMAPARKRKPKKK